MIFGFTFLSEGDFFLLVRILFDTHNSRVKIVDLFSGAGGLTFGFYYKLENGRFVRRNNQFLFANEWNRDAAKTLQENFPGIPVICRDIKTIGQDEVHSYLKNNSVDLIIGGPPCQSFSFIGKREYDDKAKLYREYERMLSILQPKMFVFENVKGMLSMKDENGVLLTEIIKQRFKNIPGKKGYNLQLKVINAVNYGVPQNRERVLIIGIREDLSIRFEYPEATSKTIVSLKEAIDDLPPIKPNERVADYRKKKPNLYQKLMRQTAKELTYHYTKPHSEKLQVVMSTLREGEGKNDFNKLVDKGLIPEKFRLTSGYHNSYGRLRGSEPSSTITNSFTTPSCLRCIHYAQNRPLSIREGARIQSFPDTFRFFGSDQQIKVQIGNAVPPLLAIAICDAIENSMKEEGQNA